jgi:hypothetical protein
MRKIVLIISAIMLMANVAVFAHNSNIPTTLTETQTNEEGKKTDTTPALNDTNGTSTQPTGQGSKPQSKFVTGVSLNKTELSLKKGGESQQLTATITPTNATNKNVSWTSKSNGQIAKVSKQGEVTPVEAGNDTIVATTEDGQKTALCVVQIDVDSLVWYKQQYNALLNTLSANTGKVVSVAEGKLEFSEAGGISGIIPDFAVYALAGIVFALGIFLFLLNKKKNNKNIDLQNEKKQFESELTKIKQENSNLANDKNHLSAEIDKLKKEHLEFRQQLQNQKNNEQQQQQRIVQQQQDAPKSLYADAINETAFAVTEQPTSDTIFELKLTRATDTQAKVVIYSGAEELIKQRPEFLDGCEKQVLGNTKIEILREGIALKEGDKWRMTATKPNVKIS